MKNKIRYILNKGKAENCSKDDEFEMFSIFHHPDKEFVVKEKLFEDLSADTLIINSDLPEIKTLFYNIWRKIEKKQKQQKNKLQYITNTLKFAAAFAIGILIGILIINAKKSIPEPLYYSALAPKGSVSEMILPDSTIIYLNADSKIRYSFDGKDGIREVFLEGEAWFDVKKNNEKPFIVHTPFYNINVTGTQFNVKAYDSDNSITTTLEKGEIIILSANNFKLAEDISIKPGEQMVLNKESRELTIKNVNTNWFTSWKDNRLIFVNMNLRELVTLLERKYGVEIEIRNTEILDLHFDGTIKNESIIEFLEIIQKTLPIHYKIVGQKIEITNKN